MDCFVNNETNLRFFSSLIGKAESPSAAKLAALFPAYLLLFTFY